MRIATFNLENLGSDTNPAKAENRRRVLRPQLERLSADILCLQEIDAPKKAGQRSPAALHDLIESTPYADYALAITAGRKGTGPADIHNLVILSRFPVLETADIRQSLVSPPRWRMQTADPACPEPVPIEWDRPLQQAALALPTGRTLHLFNVHLRAPLAARIPGQKTGPFEWKSVSGWAEGFFLSSLKRTGQALELRLAVEAVFDADPDALVAVCGDFNAEDHDTALRLACAADDDTGSGHLSPRVLTPVGRSLPAERRYTVLHHGRPQMIDHLLASRALFGKLRSVEIHNEMLSDELVAFGRIDHPPESMHAPLVAEFAD